MVDDTLAAPGAWCPVSLVPFRDGSVGRFPHIIERASRASSACSRTDGASATRATATTTTWRPCCAPCRPGRKSRPGWSAPALPAPLRPRHRAADAAAGRAVHPLRLSQARPDDRRAGPRLRDRSRTGWSGRSRSTTGTRRKARTRLRSRLDALQPARRATRQPAQPLRRADRTRAVLCGEGGARQLRHLRRIEDRCQRPRAGRGRRADPGALCGRHRHGERHGRPLSRPAASISARR